MASSSLSASGTARKCVGCRLLTRAPAVFTAIPLSRFSASSHL
jgi:hypothetical protein